METSDQRQGGGITRYERSSDETVSTGVVAAVATAADADAVPTADGGGTRVLEPLYTAVDPEALDALFDVGDAAVAGSRRVTFSYHGYEVTVTDDRRIRLERLE